MKSRTKIIRGNHLLDLKNKVGLDRSNPGHSSIQDENKLIAKMLNAKTKKGQRNLQYQNLPLGKVKNMENLFSQITKK